MGFWVVMFSLLLLADWVVSGGFITQCNVFVGYYRKNNSHLNSAYWYSFWAAFLTWFLIGFFIVLVIYAIVGAVVLFGTGVGEAGVAVGGAGAGGAVGVEALAGGEAAFGGEALMAESEAAESEGSLQQALKSYQKYFGSNSRKKPTRKQTKAQKKEKKKGKTGKILSWALLIISLILVLITGILSAIAASEIQAAGKDGFNIGAGSQVGKAYDDAIIAASLSLGAAGLLIIGMITYAVYIHKHSAQS